MKNLLKQSVVAGALALACTATEAVTVDWGPLVTGDTETATETPTPGPISDTFSFQLASSNLDASTDVAINVAFQNSSIFHISGGVYSLLSKGGNGVIGGGDDVTLGSWSFDGTTGSTSHEVALAPGKYYFDVQGTANGSNGGAYFLATALAPIPEPEIYAMLGAGLGLMGFVAYRRKRPLDAA